MISATPMILIPVDQDLLAALFICSATHYDSWCQAQSKNGFLACHRDTLTEYPDAPLRLSMREANVLMKICENTLPLVDDLRNAVKCLALDIYRAFSIGNELQSGSFKPDKYVRLDTYRQVDISTP